MVFASWVFIVVRAGPPMRPTYTVAAGIRMVRAAHLCPLMCLNGPSSSLYPLDLKREKEELQREGEC